MVTSLITSRALRLSFALCILFASAWPAKAQTPYNFVPVTPCRIADTRSTNGAFGGPSLSSGSTRSFTIPNSACGIPANAAAYSLNVTVVPQGPLSWLTIWPTGQQEPVASTLNSPDGRIKANAAIVPAGSGGAVSVFVTSTTDVILDINGYFAPITTSPALSFYPLTPCRIADTRGSAGQLGGPSMSGGQTRAFPVQASSCNVPSTAQAYSLNFTVVPKGPLGWLTVWPAGQLEPVVSTLNAPTGTVTANAAIVPAGSGGGIDAFVTNNTDLIIDINGYFAPPGLGGLSFYAFTPCRVLDTRQTGSGASFSGTLDVGASASPCVAPLEPQAYVFNTTVVPSGSLSYLTVWPQGTTQPVVSTLNAFDGAITANMAIVPTNNGMISAFATNSTQLIFDISGYFAPARTVVNTALSKVTSYEYIHAATPAYPPGILTAIADSPSDLIILGSGANNLPLNRGIADPTGSKLIFGYINVSDAVAYEEPDLFSNGSVPSWFGNPAQGYTGVFSVQYWNPGWEPEIFTQVDQIIADGYDGIFLDVCNGDLEWSQGNALGNPVYGNAVQAMATLLSDIRKHVNASNTSRPFYLMGNSPSEVALAYPNALYSLDIIFNESVYYTQLPSNGFSSGYDGLGNAQYISSTLAPIYSNTNLFIFGNDYPNPLNDPNADLLSFEFYSAFGWVPSVLTPDGTTQILSTGPFMFMATQSKPIVTGTQTFVNFLSGGKTTAATLIGGNQGDYFIGGPGTNTITGGSGNDTIYAHPANAASKGLLDIQVSATNKNGIAPTLTILINGAVALLATPVTADATQHQTQEFQFDLHNYGNITSVEVECGNISFTNVSTFNNIFVNSISLDGTALSSSNGVYMPSSNTPINASAPLVFNFAGAVSFSGSALPVSPFLSNTSDTIDGGGGTNTVIFRGASSNYTVVKQSDGSYLVTSQSTAEGPDRLVNIHSLQFSDKSITLD